VLQSKEETFESLETLYAQYPEVKEVSYNYAYALLSEGKANRAYEVVTSYLERDSGNIRFLALQLSAAKASGRLKTYERLLDEFLAKDPGNTKAHLEAAQYYALWNKEKRAKEEAWKVLAAESSNEEAFKVLAKYDDYFKSIITEEKQQKGERKRNPLKRPYLDRDFKIVKEFNFSEDAPSLL